MAKQKNEVPEIDGVQVHCAHAQLVPLEDVKPYPRNNKTHTEAQMALLCKLIKAQGFRAPVTVSTGTGYIVRGHARLEAAKRLGLSKVPVDYQTYASEAAERADRIADNKLAELAEWDIPNLKDELEDLDAGDLDMDVTGFTDADREELMTQFHVPEENDPPSAKKLRVVGVIPAEVWLNQKDDVVRAINSTAEKYGVALTWPD